MRTDRHRRADAGKELLYETLATQVADLIARGTYRPGDRLPSIRALSRQMHVSINTVLEAYAQLENRRLIEARPQSGYYVSCHLPEPEEAPAPREGWRELAASPVELGRAPLAVMRTLTDPSLVPLGRGVPDPELLPVDALNRMLAAQVRRHRLASVSYCASQGLRRLRTQIAKRSLDWGCQLSPDDLVVTSGCVEAVSLALQATCRAGDTVAIASPVYYTFLNSIQWLGLKVLEIPAAPREGISLEVLGEVLRHIPVHACVVISNFDNPLGSVLSDARKRALVGLLARHDIPLIEDDVYGDLYFGASRPTSAKAFDRKGLVLQCSSFSKTLAPGYRVGWIAPGRFREKVERLKTLYNVATTSPGQLAIAEFLTNGGYDRHLRALRRKLADRVAAMRGAISRCFPPGTRVTRPEGGFVLWIELPEDLDGFALYEQALRDGISIAPGAIFTVSGRYANCVRLNAGYWSIEVEQAVEVLGRLTAQQRDRGAGTGVPRSRLVPRSGG